MIHRILYILFSLIITLSCYSQYKMFPQPLSPRNANYDISVRLDAENKKLYGREILTWRNDSEDILSELHFHLYFNAYTDTQSTFMKELGERRRYLRLEETDGWGWITINSIITDNGDDISANSEFIQPDDGNERDQTVLRVPLNKPLNPANTIQLIIDFEAQLPNIVARSRYMGDFVFAGQWFPKIGVYEQAGQRYATEGQWNCHQFHANSEFYADYGVYDVKITVPVGYSVGATGILISETKNDDTTTTFNFYCEDVHDFAWTADTDFQVIEDQWKHIKIIYLAQPLHEKIAHRQIEAAKKTLDYCEEWFGPYPYPTLSIVDPQYRAFGVGGMEYPTLFTVRAYWLTPQGIKLPEAVTIHELAHNYWYGIVGNNEFEEPWLDEGMTTYSEIKVQDGYYGITEGSILSLFGLNINVSDWEWSSFARRPDRAVIVKKAWDFKRADYRVSTYSKPAMMLLTLENFLGSDQMKQIMRNYYERYKFKHPTTDDFIATVNEVTNEDFKWYFDQVLYTNDILDYKIERITTTPLYRQNSFTSDTISTGNKYTISANEGSGIQQTELEHLYKNEVVVAREGEVIFPVEILITFENGDEVLEKWDGKERFKEYIYEKSVRIISAEVDPFRKIWLDVNLLNNGKCREINRAASIKYLSRWLFWMQNFLHFVSIFS